MNFEIHNTLETYFLRIPEDIQPYLLFVLGILFGLIWTGLSNGLRYLKPLTKRKGVPMQCYSTICRSRRRNRNKIACYSPTCQNKKALISRANFKSA